MLNGVTFVLFGAILLGPALGELSWELVLYAVLSLTLMRMVPVAIAMLGSHARLPTLGFLGWFGPRGLASIVFAVILIEESAASPRAPDRARDLPHGRALGLRPRAHRGSAGRPLRGLVRAPPPRQGAADGERPDRGDPHPRAATSRRAGGVDDRRWERDPARHGLPRARASDGRGVARPETKALPVVAGVLLFTGTLFYWRFEDWSIIQSLYFCVVTLTTVGFGDLDADQRRNAAVHDLLHPHRPRHSRRPAGFGRRAVHRAEVRAHQRPRAPARPARPAPGLEGGGTAIALRVHPFGAMTAPPRRALGSELSMASDLQLPAVPRTAGASRPSAPW